MVSSENCPGKKQLQGYSQGEPFDDLKLPRSINEKQSMIQGDSESISVPNDQNDPR